jgi:hypothetical protein
MAAEVVAVGVVVVVVVVVDGMEVLVGVMACATAARVPWFHGAASA